MSKAALVAGADGVIVEVHFQPESAMSDGNQSLDSSMYRKFIKEMSWLVERLQT